VIARFDIPQARMVSHFPTSAFLFVLAAALLLPASAAAEQKAAEPKPALSVTTRAADISVEIDGKLNRFPGLQQNLMAEGRRWVDSMRKEAEKSRQDDPQLFGPGRRWSLERRYDLVSEVGRYISILRTDDTYEGGAHPNLEMNTLLWDRDAKKRISIRPFFKETADNGPTMQALARLVRTAVGAEKIARDLADPRDPDKPGSTLSAQQYAESDPSIRDGIQPTLLKLGPVTLAPSTVANKSAGLNFHFSPYAVGAYAEGAYTVLVPWHAFKDRLSSEGLATFAGDLPEGEKSRYDIRQ
jgi:hypothetical protein